MIKQKKDAGTIRNRKEKTTQGKHSIELEEINQKVLVKEGRLKRYRQRVKQYRQTGNSKTMKENSISNWEESTMKHTNNQMKKKPNDFGPKYGNKKNITKSLNG